MLSSIVLQIFFQLSGYHVSNLEQFGELLGAVPRGKEALLAFVRPVDVLARAYFEVQLHLQGG